MKESEKEKAALEAVKNIKNGQIVGLGTGSTSTYAIKEIGRRIKEEGLDILGIPTSNQSESMARKYKIPLTNLDENPKVDISIDGADQVDLNLNLIKGGLGALTREKIIDGLSKQLIIIIDESKFVEKLGINKTVPIEVLNFATRPVMDKIHKLRGKPTIRKSEKGFFISDNGNFIIDADFGIINNVELLERELKMIPGVIECGLFVGMVDIVYIGYSKEVKKIKKVKKNE